MRISRFRGKRLDNGKWAIGDLEYCRAKNVARIHTYDAKGYYECQHEVHPDTVGQYTGLNDNNGKEIYEGDVLRMYDNNNYTFTCIYLQTQSAFLGKCNETQLGLANITEGVSKEIIGNIHDNHELLKTE